MKKNLIIIIFLIVGVVVLYNFRGHNQNRAIEACMAGSKKLEQPMTAQEAKKFCEEQIKNR